MIGFWAVQRCGVQWVLSVAKRLRYFCSDKLGVVTKTALMKQCVAEGVWARSAEAATRKYARATKGNVYAITGPVYEPRMGALVSKR